MAPWVPLFQQSCKNNLTDMNPFTPFQFSTSEITKNTDQNIEEIKPRVRTVVLRDFLFNDKRTNVLTFHSDLRSEKMKVKNDQKQYFEGCFYFPSTWEQYRISGEWFNISLNGDNDIDDHKLTKYGILIKESIRSNQTHVKHATNDITSATTKSTTTNTTTTNDELNDSNEICDNDNNDNDDRNEITEVVYRFPQCNDWKEEVMRQWNGLSRAAKALYRKPAPGEILTVETSKKLDKIQRGVDGAKEDAGLENFSVVCLLIDQVDYLNLKDGRGGERRIFRRCCDAVLSKKDVKGEKHAVEEEEEDEEEEEKGEEAEEEDDDECEILSEHEVWTEVEVCP